jgi:hypothetical protein
VVDASIEESHSALFVSTGRPVMDVFQTLFFGNAGQVVPGRSKPGVAGGGAVVDVVCPVVEVVDASRAPVVVVVTTADVVVVAADVDVVGARPASCPVLPREAEGSEVCPSRSPEVTVVDEEMRAAR